MSYHILKILASNLTYNVLRGTQKKTFLNSLPSYIGLIQMNLTFSCIAVKAKLRKNYYNYYYYE